MRRPSSKTFLAAGLVVAGIALVPGTAARIVDMAEKEWRAAFVAPAEAEIGSILQLIDPTGELVEVAWPSGPAAAMVTMDREPLTTASLPPLIATPPDATASAAPPWPSLAMALAPSETILGRREAKDDPQPGLEAADIALLRRGFAALRKGDTAELEAVSAKLADPMAKSLLEWVALRTTKGAVGFARIERFLAAHPEWPGRAALQRRAEASLYHDKLSSRVVRAFFQDRKPVSVQGRIALASALAEEGRHQEAAALAREAWRRDAFGAAIELDILSRFPDAIDKADLRHRMERLIFQEKFADATRVAGRLGKDWPTLVKARAAVEGKAGNAQALLDAVPTALREDTSYRFAVAQKARRDDKPRDAARALEGVPRDAAILADGDEWWVERRIIARKLVDIGAYKDAYAVAAGHAAESPASRVEAEFHAGWIALRFLGDAVTATVHFEAAIDAAETPISLARAHYWSGRAAEAAGDTELARQRWRAAAEHSATYYGQIARASLGEVDIALRRPSFPAHVSEALDAALAPRVVKVLYRLGEGDFARRFVADLAQESTDVALLDRVGDITTAENDARGTLMLGKLAMRRGLALDRHAFPLVAMPDATPDKRVVDASVLFSIARQESAFDPKAVSHAGALGLMQLMPATARTTASRIGVPFDAGRLTSDPAYNVQVGGAHLAELLGDWRGSLILTFAAYNAGAGNVKKWLQLFGDPRDPGIDPIDWVERIPFTETRDYVQRIMENMQIYRVRLGERNVISILDDLKLGKRQTAASEL